MLTDIFLPTLSLYVRPFLKLLERKNRKHCFYFTHYRIHCTPALLVVSYTNTTSALALKGGLDRLSSPYSPIICDSGPPSLKSRDQCINTLQSSFEGTKAGHKVCFLTDMHQMTESTNQTQTTLANNMRYCVLRNTTLVSMERGSQDSYRLMNQKAGTGSHCWAKKPSGIRDKAQAVPFNCQ